MSFLCLRGLSSSRTIKIKLHVLATKTERIVSNTSLATNKGRFGNNSQIDILISKRLSVENKAKLSQLTRADFATIAKFTH